MKLLDYIIFANQKLIYMNVFKYTEKQKDLQLNHETY